MSIDNVSWHARVGIFYALNHCSKVNQVPESFEIFSLTFFFGIPLVHLSCIDPFFNCILIKKSNILSTIVDYAAQNGKNRNIFISLPSKFTFLLR